MKKVLALLLSCILLLAMMPAAFAEPAPVVLEYRRAELNPLTGTVAASRGWEECWELLDAEGNVLVPESEGYISMDPQDAFFLVEKESEDAILPCKGLLSGQGEVILPARYHDVDVLSDRWQVGVMLSPTDEDNWSYAFFTDQGELYYTAAACDFYFDGEFVGTLDAESCTSIGEAYGAYVCVYTANGASFYNSKLELSPVETSVANEYDWDYLGGRQVYFHQGSGQMAFTPGCTLDPADVSCRYMAIDNVLYGLHGEELAVLPESYDSVGNFVDNYAMVRVGDKYGLINEKGEEVLAPEYDDIGKYEEHPLRCGYISVEKDGLFGIADAQGNLTCDFRYPAEEVDNYGSFAILASEDGVTVLSAAVGELPEHYDWVFFPVTDGCLAFVASRADGSMGIVNLQGETILPFSSEYYDLQVTVDGSLALAELDEGYVILHL